MFETVTSSISTTAATAAFQVVTKSTRHNAVIHDGQLVTRF